MKTIYICKNSNQYYVINNIVTKLILNEVDFWARNMRAKWRHFMMKMGTHHKDQSIINVDMSNNRV